MKSISQTVEKHVYYEIDGSELNEYVGALEYTFEVLEYLKGSGGSEIVGVVYDLDVGYETRAGAMLGEDFLGWRETRWDAREAIVFLKDNEERLPSTYQSGRYWLGHLRYQGQEDYTIGSVHDKNWLPDASSSGAVGASGSGGQRLLTDVPSGVETDAEAASGTSVESPSIRRQILP